MRADLGGLADDRQVEVIDPPAAIAHALCREGEELGRGGPAPLRIARREMRADIAFGQRTEQGVGQGMQADITVGMGDDALVMRNPHAAEPDMVAGREGMDVVTGADP